MLKEASHFFSVCSAKWELCCSFAKKRGNHVAVMAPNIDLQVRHPAAVIGNCLQWKFLCRNSLPLDNFVFSALQHLSNLQYLWGVWGRNICPRSKPRLVKAAQTHPLCGWQLQPGRALPTPACHSGASQVSAGTWQCLARLFWLQGNTCVGVGVQLLF